MPSSGFTNNNGGISSSAVAAAAADKLLPALHHAVSGSAGTLISTCALYPLSLVITRLQAQRQLRREGKLHDLSSRSRSRSRSHSRNGTTTLTPNEKAEAEAEARARARANTTTTGPDPAATRDPTYANGIAEAFSRTWSSGGGPKAFYTGLGQDATKSVLDSFLFFLFYEWLRSARLASHGNRRSRRGGWEKSASLGVLEELAVGVVAGVCSRFFTTPIANVVTRQQTASLMDKEGRRKISMQEIIESIRREEGLSGFWSGYSASLVLTLNPSITFFLNEFLKQRALTADRYERPGFGATFLLAAVSKAVASAITYPFQIAKTRMQTGIPAVAEGKRGRDKDKDRERAETPAPAPAPTEAEASKEPEPPKEETEASKEDQTSVEAQASEGAETAREEEQGESAEDVPKGEETPEQAQAAPATAEGEAPAEAVPAPADESIAPDEIPATTAPEHVEAPRDPVTIHNVAPPERGVDPSLGTEALRAAREFGRRSIFGTMAQIARTEGVGSLYDGIQGELLKGFLSHGTTMLAKDVVHRLLFRLYFIAAGVLVELRNRRARAGPVAGRVRENVKEDVRESTRSVVEAGREVVAPMTAPTKSLPAPTPTPPSPAPPPAILAPAPASAPASAPTPAPAPAPVPVSSPIPAPISMPPQQPRQQPPLPPQSRLRALKYRIDNNLDGYRYEQPVSSPSRFGVGAPISNYHYGSDARGRPYTADNRPSKARSIDELVVNVVANMIDGTQRGIKE